MYLFPQSIFFGGMKITVAIDGLLESTRSFNYLLPKDETHVVSLSIEYLVDSTCDRKNNTHINYLLLCN